MIIRYQRRCPFIIKPSHKNLGAWSTFWRPRLPAPPSNRPCWLILWLAREAWKNRWRQGGVVEFGRQTATYSEDFSMQQRWDSTWSDALRVVLFTKWLSTSLFDVLSHSWEIGCVKNGIFSTANGPCTTRM